MAVQIASQDIINKINQQIQRLNLSPDEYFDPMEGLTAERPSPEYTREFFIDDTTTPSVKIVFGKGDGVDDGIYKAPSVLKALSEMSPETLDIEDEVLVLWESCEY